jgi:hypothetical protein
VKATPKAETPKAGSGKVDFENETIYFRHNSFWISQNQQGTKGSIIAKKLKENSAMRIRIEGWASQPGDESYLFLNTESMLLELKLLVEVRLKILIFQKPKQEEQEYLLLTNN